MTFWRLLYPYILDSIAACMAAVCASFAGISRLRGPHQFQHADRKAGLSSQMHQKDEKQNLCTKSEDDRNFSERKGSQLAIGPMYMLP